MLEDFQDAFRRYLRAVSPAAAASPGVQSATTQQANTRAASECFSKRNTEEAVAPAESEVPNKNGTCCGVAVSQPAPVNGETGVEEEL